MTEGSLISTKSIAQAKSYLISIEREKGSRREGGRGEGGERQILSPASFFISTHVCLVPPGGTWSASLRTLKTESKSPRKACLPPLQGFALGVHSRLLATMLLSPPKAEFRKPYSLASLYRCIASLCCATHWVLLFSFGLIHPLPLTPVP